MSKKKCIIDKYDTIYEFSVYVVVNPDKKIVDDYFEWKNDEDKSILLENTGFVAYTNCGVYGKRDKKQCIVVVFNNISENMLENINTCAHESLHVVMDIMRSAHVKFSDDSEEAFAYLQGWITERLYKTISKV